jgi:hypothetical protein
LLIDGDQRRFGADAPNLAPEKRAVDLKFVGRDHIFPAMVFKIIGHGLVPPFPSWPFPVGRSQLAVTNLGRH